MCRHHLYISQPSSSPPKETSCPSADTLISHLTDSPMATTNLLSVSMGLLALGDSCKRERAVVALHVWLLSLNVTFSRFIQAVESVSTLLVLWWSNMPSGGDASFCSSIYRWMDVGVPTFWWLCILCMGFDCFSWYEQPLVGGAIIIFLRRRKLQSWEAVS